MHNESAFLIITDNHSDLLWGFPSDSNRPPIAWLNSWLSQYAPRDDTHKYCCMDQGGELSNHKEVTALVLLHGYVVRLPGGGASHQNAPAERPHQTIGHSLRTMLHGAGLPFKLWTYAFHHYIMLHNDMSHGNCDVPVISAGGPFPHLGYLHTFGCRVVVRPPGPRPSKLEVHTNIGNFLGYTTDRTQAHCIDSKTKKIKMSTHVRYEEGICDSDDPSPNARQLHVALGQPLPAESTDAPMSTDLDLTVMSSPFTELVTLSLKVRCDEPYLGFVFGVCAARSRAFIVDIQRDSTASKIKDWRRKYHGAYIVEVYTHPVFTAEDTTRLLSAVRDSAPQNTAPVFTVFLAPDTPPSKATPDTGIPHLQMAQFRTAISALYEIGEGKKIPRDALDGDYVLSTAINVISDGEIRPGKKWTRRQLKPLASWTQWYGAEKEQLDQMHIAKMFGPPESDPQTPWSFDLSGPIRSNTMAAKRRVPAVMDPSSGHQR
jgi:hypothetical protein